MSKTTKRINFKEKLIDDCLELSLSGLESVPVKEIAEITKARKLNLAYNALTLLPNDFIKLQHIKEIDLSKNKLKELPKNIGQLTNLKNLDLLGNQLTDLPSSFCELKGLQWLDLKDNPLNPALKAAAGDCLDEKQCKKCAINVMNYCKQKAAEEDRLRQIESKKKKELQLKNEAEEREKANQLKLQKKQERQQKHKITEQKNREEESQDNSESNSEETSNLVGSKSSKSTSNKNSSSGFCGSIITAFLLIAVFTLLAISTYILATSYCRLPARLTIDLRKNEYVKPVLELIDEKLCPYTDKDSEFFNTIIRTLQNYFQT